MKCRKIIMQVGLVFSLSFAPLIASAETTTAPPLVIREIKIMGDEFVVLHANVHIANLSDYWIGYVGSDTVNPGSVVPSQQLPAYSLDAGDAVLMTSDGAETCDAVLVTKLSVALSDTKGTFVVRHYESTGLTSTFTTIDSVNWIKPSASATTTDNIDLRKETATLQYPVWYHDPAHTKPWRVGNLAGCVLTMGSQTVATETETIAWVREAIEPPAIIENVNDIDTSDDAVLVSNAGLAPPLITELMPNPLGTGTDATDEFIELYNSNDASFNLGGFTLRTGLTTTYTWKIPVGTIIAPQSFKVFFATETSLSMSNTSGQATLLDANDTMVAQTDPYESAPDGQAWALANGTWYWTTKATPAATNTIAQPIVKPATAAKRLTTATKNGTVKGASSAKKTKATTQKATNTASKNFASANASTTSSSSIHPAVLALVAAAALGYGLYEYRHDVANAFHKLRRH